MVTKVTPLSPMSITSARCAVIFRMITCYCIIHRHQTPNANTIISACKHSRGKLAALKILLTKSSTDTLKWYVCY